MGKSMKSANKKVFFKKVVFIKYGFYRHQHVANYRSSWQKQLFIYGQKDKFCKNLEKVMKKHMR